MTKTRMTMTNFMFLRTVTELVTPPTALKMRCHQQDHLIQLLCCHHRKRLREKLKERYRWT